MTNVTPYLWCTFFLLQHFCAYKLATRTIIYNVEVGRIYFINVSFVLLFQAKAIALAAKNGKDVCVCVSKYLQSI